jgi:hypothetical protein
LEGSLDIQTPHVAEAIQYRSLDKNRLGGWGVITLSRINSHFRNET